MVKVGDKVYVTKPEYNMFGAEAIVHDTLIDDEYATYYGQNCIIVKNKHGQLIAVNKGEYKLKERPMQTYYNVKDENKPDVQPTEFITPNKKMNGLQQQLYMVIESHNHGCTVYDDSGEYMISLPKGSYEKADISDVFVYMNSLQGQIVKLQRVIKELGNIIAADIKEGLKKLS